MSRVLLVGKGPPDRGGISAFLQTLLGSELATSHQLSLLNLYRDEVLRGGRFTRANITRTLVDAKNLWLASRQVDVVHINTALVPSATLSLTPVRRRSEPDIPRLFTHHVALCKGVRVFTRRGSVTSCMSATSTIHG